MPPGTRPKNPPLTHFLAIPLVTPSSRPALESSLFHLQTCIRDNQKNETHEKTHVPLDAVRPVGTLHLTLGVMSLRGEERVREAVKALEGLELGGLLRGERGKGAELERNLRADAADAEEDAARVEEEADYEAQEGTARAESPNKRRLDSLTRTISPPLHVPPPGRSQTPVNQPLRSPAHQSLHHPPLSFIPSLEPDPNPLTLSLTSLRPMHRPAATSVLYAVPNDPTGRLLTFCQRLRTFFTERGFMVSDERALKLHVTVVNTVYARAVAKPRVRGMGGAEKRGRDRGSAGAGAGAGAEEKEKEKELDKDRDKHDDAAANATTAEDEQCDDAAGPHVTHQHEHHHEAGPPDKDIDTDTAQRQHETRPGRRPTARTRTRAKPLQLDARPLLARFEHFTWAEDIRVESLAICRMGAVKVRDEGGRVVGEEYVVVGERRFSC